MIRFKTSDITGIDTQKDMRYIIFTKDGRIFKLRKTDMDKEELEQVLAFFLQ